MITVKRKVTAVLVGCLVALAWPDSALAQSEIERARMLYNSGEFEQAIAAATVAKDKPAWAQSATLIIARSRLERFRRLGDPAQLAAARAELVSLNHHNLAPQEVIEWQIGVGTALFLDDQLGPAAAMFTTVLPTARRRLKPAEFDKLLEWWGTSMSRLAENLTGDARKRAYEQLRADAARELERNPLSPPAAYWTVVASRGAGDFDAAWNAAVVGWIRAGAQPEGRQLRSDLEGFVTRTLIPERAQARTGQRLDAKTTVNEIAAMTEEWRAVTGRWGSAP